MKCSAESRAAELAAKSHTDENMAEVSACVEWITFAGNIGGMARVWVTVRVRVRAAGHLRWECG